MGVGWFSIPAFREFAEGYRALRWVSGGFDRLSLSGW